MEERQQNFMSSDKVIEVVFGEDNNVVLEINISVAEMFCYDFCVDGVVQMIWMVVQGLTISYTNTNKERSKLQ